MKFKEQHTKDFNELTQEIIQYWKENKIFEKSESSSSNENFTFYEGPPSANGKPGIHHMLSRIVKDVICRYKTMQGYNVKRKGGWDTHGLPVELEVEEKLNINKNDIGKTISVEEFNKECRKTVLKYKKEWEDFTEKIGYWIDLENPYLTFDNNYIESIWYSLKQLFNKNLLYNDYTIQPYSPAAGTGLSSHELNQEGCYKEVKDTSVVAQFKIKNRNEYFLVWTTTPWTLFSNSALAVRNDFKYLLIKTINKYTNKVIYVYLLEDKLYDYFSKEGENQSFDNYDKIIPFEIIKEVYGKDLVDLEYEQLLPYVNVNHKLKVYHADFINKEEGTGIVHIAPTFGVDDMKLAKKYNIPSVLTKDEEGNYTPLVDKEGKFVKELDEFAYRYIKPQFSENEEQSVDIDIAIKLKKENKAFLIEKIKHNYPHCWRTNKPIIYYPLKAWFIKTTSYKDKLCELNNKINWKPKSTGEGRFGNWLENTVDWNLSRTRYFGTPLPIWQSDDEVKCISSLEELKQEINKSIKEGFMDEQISDDFDLHRPYIDDIILVSSNNKPMYRVEDVIDVWYDSGSMPFSQFHYPFENKEKFHNRFPADFIAEGIDQTRGWFYTLHVLSTILFDNIAYKNVIANGLVLDKNGNKMSKSLGNVIDPFELIEHHGSDVIRWYMLSNTAPWDNLNFDIEGLKQVKNKFFNTIENVYNFFVLYANIDNYDKEECELKTESDKWIISTLNSLIYNVKYELNNYEPHKAIRLIQNFVINDLSNWYLRLNRKRFWKKEYDNDKKSAYYCLYNCLISIIKLMAPFSPFYSEKLFLNLENKESVHLANFPSYNNNLINSELEEDMLLARDISSKVHSLRKRYNLKVRQPLNKILIPISNKKQQEKIRKFEDLIKNETNLKNIEYYYDTDNILTKEIKPNYKKLGKVYGSKMKDITSKINELKQEDINFIEKEGYINLGEIQLGVDDVEIKYKDIDGWVVESDDNVTIALDTIVTNELKKEGISRELINKIQNLRKELEFNITDKISVDIDSSNELINKSINQYYEFIKTETQSYKLNSKKLNSYDKEFNIDNNKVFIKIN